MGFLSNLIGDVECDIIALDTKLSSKACDRKTKATGCSYVTRAELAERKAAAKATNAAMSKDEANKLPPEKVATLKEEIYGRLSAKAKESKSKAGKMQVALPDKVSNLKTKIAENLVNEAAATMQSKIPVTSVTDRKDFATKLACNVFNAIYNTLVKRGYTYQVSTDIGNVIAGMIMENPATASKIKEYLNIDIIADRARKGGITDDRIGSMLLCLESIDNDKFMSDVDTEMSSIVSAEHKSVSNEKSMTKPIIMDYSQFVEPVAVPV